MRVSRDSDIHNVALTCYTPLTISITHYSTGKCRNLYILQLAIAHNIDIEKKTHGNSLIVRAICCDNLLALNVLIMHGVNVNSDKGEPLRIAIRRRNVTIIDTLLRAGVDVNLTPPGGRCAFALAIEYTDINTVSKLFMAGAVIPYYALETTRITQIDKLAKIDFIQSNRHLIK